MSNTMHIHSKHVVEYKDSGEFKWLEAELQNLLYNLNVSVYDNSEDGCSFEIPKKSLEKAIQTLKDISDGKEPQDENLFIEDVKSILVDLGKTPHDMIKTFNWMLENAAPDHDVVFVDFF